MKFKPKIIKHPNSLLALLFLPVFGIGLQMVLIEWWVSRFVNVSCRVQWRWTLIQLCKMHKPMYIWWSEHGMSPYVQRKFQPKHRTRTNARGAAGATCNVNCTENLPVTFVLTIYNKLNIRKLFSFKPRSHELKKSLYAATGDGRLHLIFRWSATSARTQTFLRMALA